MKRMILVMAATLAIVGAVPALAADLPQAPPQPPQAPAAYVPTVAPVYNWGGIYFGANAGYGFGSTDWTSSVSGSPSTGDFNTSGAVLGPTLGVNFQTDAFVFGVEGDFDGSWIDGKDSSCSLFLQPATCETKNTWLGTIRARAGYAADRVLFYGTAGGAWGNIEANTGPLTCSTPGPGCSEPYQKTSKLGWTAGAGVEVAFAENWTARVEYLFVDLTNATFPGLTPPSTTTVKFDANLIRLGVDYKFR